jgi:hypothetical protein
MANIYIYNIYIYIFFSPWRTCPAGGIETTKQPSLRDIFPWYSQENWQGDIPNFDGWHPPIRSGFPDTEKYTSWYVQSRTKGKSWQIKPALWCLSFDTYQWFSTEKQLPWILECHQRFILPKRHIRGLEDSFPVNICYFKIFKGFILNNQRHPETTTTLDLHTCLRGTGGDATASPKRVKASKRSCKERRVWRITHRNHQTSGF